MRCALKLYLQGSMKPLATLLIYLFAYVIYIKTHTLLHMYIHMCNPIFIFHIYMHAYVVLGMKFQFRTVAYSCADVLAAFQ